MYLLGLGIILLLLKWQQIAPVAHWPWWWVLAPFLGAALWWTWADWSGYTKRRAADRADARKLKRIHRQRKALNSSSRTAPPRRR